MRQVNSRVCFDSYASNRLASRSGARCELAGRGCRQPAWDRRSARASARPAVAKSGLLNAPDNDPRKSPKSRAAPSPTSRNRCSPSSRITVQNHPGLAFGIIPESRSRFPGNGSLLSDGAQSFCAARPRDPLRRTCLLRSRLRPSVGTLFNAKVSRCQKCDLLRRLGATGCPMQAGYDHVYSNISKSYNPAKVVNTPPVCCKIARIALKKSFLNSDQGFFSDAFSLV
jgi:hypothetical protein